MTLELLPMIDGATVQHAIAPWIIPAIVAVAGKFLGGGGGGSAPNTSAAQMTPEMRQLFGMELNRMRAQTPLYNNVLGMANAMLPIWARQQDVTGITTPPVPGPDGPGADHRMPSDDARQTGRRAIPRGY